jgi:hypothetical protein
MRSEPDLRRRCTPAVIARITPYHTPPDALEPLIDEIVALARARSRPPVEQASRRAEFFFVDTSSGDGLSLVVGDDPTVRPMIELARPPRGDSEEYDVHLLQVGGPRGSGVVQAVFGQVVRCDAGAVDELSFDGDAVPTSPDVWPRALLVAPDVRVLAFAVGPDRAALEQSLEKFSSRSTQVDHYDEVAYHFFLGDP